MDNSKLMLYIEPHTTLRAHAGLILNNDWSCSGIIYIRTHVAS